MAGYFISSSSPRQHSQQWWPHSQQRSWLAEFCACRAIQGGATNVLCRAIRSGATKVICHAIKSKMQSLLGLGTQWRGRRDLSRQHHWRDKPTLSRHCIPKPSRACIFDLEAWQVPLVAPLLMPRQEHNSVLLLPLAADCFWCCGIPGEFHCNMI